MKGKMRVMGAKNFVSKAMVTSFLAPGESVIQNVPDIRGVRAIANLLHLHGAKANAEKEAGVAKTNASSLPIRVLSRSIIIFRIPKDSIHLLPTTYHAADLSYEGSRSNSPLNRLRCGLIKCPDETLIHSSIHIQYFASHISHRQRTPSS